MQGPTVWTQPLNRRLQPLTIIANVITTSTPQLLRHTSTHSYADASIALLMDAIIAILAIRGKSISPRTPSAVKGKLY